MKSHDDAYPELNSTREAGDWALRQFRSGRTSVRFADLSHLIPPQGEPLDCFTEILMISKADGGTVQCQGGRVIVLIYRAPRYGLN